VSRGTWTIGALVIATALGGCVSAPGRSPAWFGEREAALGDDYPSLRDIPTGTIANVDQRYWASVEADVVAAGAAMKAHPRAAPPTGEETPAEFIEEAREDLESTRQAHTPQ